MSSLLLLLTTLTQVYIQFSLTGNSENTKHFMFVLLMKIFINFFILFYFILFVFPDQQTPSS